MFAGQRMGFLDRLASLPPSLVWGLLSRGVGLVYLISFASLAQQVVPAAGSDGLVPVRDGLRRIERDFPTWKRFFYFPTLLWLGASDSVLVAHALLGVVAGAVIVAGGPLVPAAFVACYVLYLSLDRAMVLVYPWDSILLEAGFWGAFLPATHLLPDVTALSGPDPAVAWVFRLLVFRVMFGFGKHKFLGATPQDRGYLKGFYISQPLPTIFGWASHRVPMFALRAAIFVMFLSEIPGPFLVFFPGRLAALGGALVIVLMAGIWVGGTFGFFNWLVAFLALSWFDTETARAFSLSEFLAPGHFGVVHALVALHMWLALLSSFFNTFCANTWMLWPWWTRIRPRFLTAPITLIRVLHPLRWLHAYGVFPPQSPPAAKMVPTLEVTWDEQHWEPVELSFWPVLETSRPRFCAPHHPRLDQAVLYEAFGVTETSLARNFMGRFDPYGFGRATGGSLMMRAVVEGRGATRLLPRGALTRGRPVAARMRSYLLEPTTPSEARRSGKFWHRRLVGPHIPAKRPGDREWEHSLLPPELWHFEDLIWLERSNVGALMRRAADGEDPHALATVDADDVDPGAVERFWGTFVPSVGVKDDFAGLRREVEKLRDTFDRDELFRFERLIGRYGAFLYARLEPLFDDRGILPVFGKVHATLDVKSYFHLRLLAHYVIAQGKAVYDDVCREPRRAVEHAASMTLASGSRLLALFNYESFVFQSQKLRAYDRFIHHEGRVPPNEPAQRKAAVLARVVRRLWGALELAEFLKEQFSTEEDVLDVPECWPSFRVTENGSVVRIEATEMPTDGAPRPNS